eukprot:TRINITY_DN8406_c0_g1_i1.p1 TRINITY_DN8406_c0_g1~~TRINITY_DN8406_c0_g1_i1.p1  ORF type:complete len:1030 (-),score=221.15 TRINITY_DN8406_c0_g1_i1:69-3158(-)
MDDLKQLGAVALDDAIAKESLSTLQEEWFEEVRVLSDIVETISSVIAATKVESSPSAQQVAEVFDLLVALLESDDSPARLSFLLFDAERQPNVLSALVHFMRSPNVLAQELRHGALSAFAHILRLCSPVPVRIERYGNNARRVTAHCTQAVIKTDAVPALLACCLSDAKAEVRAFATECIALLVESGEMGALAVLVQKGLPLLLQQMSQDLSADVRRFCALAVRTCCRMYSDDVLGEEGLAVIVSAFAVDASADVRALCAESLAHLFYNNRPALNTAVTVQHVHDVIRKRIAADSSPRVIEAALRLLEVILRFCERIFCERFVECGGVQTLLERTMGAPPIAPLAMKVLRVLVECAPPSLQVPRRVIFHFPSLATLLKIVHARADVQDDELRTELSLALGLMCAADPTCRDRLRRELAPFPVYLSSLKKTLLQSLTAAEPEVFVNMHVFDVSGRLLNNERTAEGPPERFARSVLKEQQLLHKQDKLVEAEGLDSDAQYMAIQSARPAEVNSEAVLFAARVAAELVFLALDMALTYQQPRRKSSPEKLQPPPVKPTQRGPPPFVVPTAASPRQTTNSPARQQQIMDHASIPILPPQFTQFLRKGSKAPRSPVLPVVRSFEDRSLSPPRVRSVSPKQSSPQHRSPSPRRLNGGAVSPSPSRRDLDYCLPGYVRKAPLRETSMSPLLVADVPKSRLHMLPQQHHPVGVLEQIRIRIPADGLTRTAVDHARQQLQKQKLVVKKQLLIVPAKSKSNKDRRRQLSHMSHVCMQVEKGLDDLLKLIDSYGEQHVSANAKRMTAEVTEASLSEIVKRLQGAEHNVAAVSKATPPGTTVPSAVLVNAETSFASAQPAPRTPSDVRSELDDELVRTRRLRALLDSPTSPIPNTPSQTLDATESSPPLVMVAHTAEPQIVPPLAVQEPARLMSPPPTAPRRSPVLSNVTTAAIRSSAAPVPVLELGVRVAPSQMQPQAEGIAEPPAASDVSEAVTPVSVPNTEQVSAQDQVDAGKELVQVRVTARHEHGEPVVDVAITSM